MQVNDYIRTKDGIIYKVDEINKVLVNIGGGGFSHFGYLKNENDWASFHYYNENNEISINNTDRYKYDGTQDIIDLIKPGDYVNGYLVYSGGKKHFDYIITWDTKKDYYMKIPLNLIDIKSVLTKEQFEARQYNVKHSIYN